MGSSISLGSGDGWSASESPEASWAHRSGRGGSEVTVLEAARPGGAPPVKVTLRVVDFDQPSALGLSGCAVVLAAFQRAKDGEGSFDAPLSTSFGAYARGAGIKLGKGKPKDAERVNEEPPLTKLVFEGGGTQPAVGDLWLVESPHGLLTAERVASLYGALRLNVSRLKGRAVALPLLGYNHSEIGLSSLRVAVQEAAGFVRALARQWPRADEGPSAVHFLVPSEDVLQAAQRGFQRELGKGGVLAGLTASGMVSVQLSSDPSTGSDLAYPLAGLADRVQAWLSGDGKDVAYVALRGHLEVVVRAVAQHAGKPPAEVERQVAFVVCDAGERVAEAFTDQFAGLPGFRPEEPLENRAVFLRTARSSEGSTSALDAGGNGSGKSSSDLRRATSTRSTRDLAADSKAGVPDPFRNSKGYIGARAFEALESLRLQGAKAGDPACSSVLNAVDAAFALDSILTLLGSLTSPLSKPKSARGATDKIVANVTL